MKKYAIFLFLMIGAVMTLGACSPKTAAEQPEKVQSHLTSLGICGQTEYTVFTYKEVSDFKCEDNDTFSVVIDGNRVRGYVREQDSKYSVYENTQINIIADMDVVDQTDYVIAVTDCTPTFVDGNSSPGFQITPVTSGETYGAKCLDEGLSVNITGRFTVNVISNTTIVPPESPAVLIPWEAMEEGKWYNFCVVPDQFEMKVKFEGYQPDTVYLDCIQGKLLNKLAYRIITPYFHTLNDVVITLFPENVAGGYPFVKASDLLTGRIYDICPTDEKVMWDNASEPAYPLTNCLRGLVYLGQDNNKLWLFDSFGTKMSFSLTGAFPSPKP